MSDPFPTKISHQPQRIIMALKTQPDQELSVLCCGFVTNKDILKHFVSRGLIPLLSLNNSELLLRGVGGVVVTTGLIAGRERGVDWRTGSTY